MIRMSAVKGGAWVLMVLLAAIVSAYAIGLIFIADIRPPFLCDRFANHPLSTYSHLIGSAVALTLGAFQVNNRLRSKHLRIHRLTGKIYLVGVLVGAPGAFGLALVSEGGLVTHFGFGLLAVLWFGTTARAFYAIRHRDIIVHRAWMIRSYALCLAAVTLRLYLPMSMAAGLPTDQAYQAISWLCWVPNLIVVEWLVLGGKASTAIPAT